MRLWHASPMNQKWWLVLCLLGALDLALLRDMILVRPHLQLHTLDVGQGDALLLITPEQHHVLIDGGPGNKVLTELAAVLPQTMHEIDLLVITHPHLDHIEGLVAVLDRFPVKQISLSLPDYDSELNSALLEKIAELNIPISIPQASQDFRLGETVLDVIYPFDPVTGGEFENVNNVSTVIRVVHSSGSILLTGDAEQELEAELVGLNLKSDLLKAGHHGSRTSSTLEFLRQVNPEWMVISCGVDNSYGHPSPETLEKATSMGIEVMRTDLAGRVSIIFAEPYWMRSILAPRLRSFSSSPS